MNRLVDLRPQFAKQAVRQTCRIALVLLLASLPLLAATKDTGDKDSVARDQFATAVRMRTMLEGYLEKDRSIADYKQTIDAYHKVYVISTEAEEVPSAIIAQAELYEEMGRLYDPIYFQSAINTYGVLIDQYPGSRYRSGAAFAIALIEKNDLKKLDQAQASLQDFLKKYPRSEKAAEARQALQEIAATHTAGPAKATSSSNALAQTPTAATAAVLPAQPNTKASPVAAPAVVETVDDDPAVAGDRVTPRALDGRLADVKDVQTKNTSDWSRVILMLGDTVEFESARIESPDRIYFNISRAKLSSRMAVSRIDLADGLTKSVRVAQNKPDVVRVVLDAPGAKDYTAYLLSKPYRLVIELQTKPMSIAKRMPPPAQTTTPGDATPPSNTVASSTGPAIPVVNSLRPKTTPVAARKGDVPPTSLDAPIAPKPTRGGDTSLTRALGLKISRIVIDAGHGGHDTGTIGPHGLMEKDLCLDVALRLGKIIEQKLPSADVVYTRKDDSFVPLEDRTRIANDAKADLFISIHANSSPDPAARGIETYYLNFATSDDALAVAARENATSQESVHDLQDVLQKIARNDKIAESRELAGDIQNSLSQRMASISTREKDRGVKKAPFVVLIGADMPSVLSEISFVSNPTDERMLKKTDQRQRIADGLYRGISSYLESLNSLSYNQQKFISDNRAQPGDSGQSASTAK
jgi:N-acetylmuramoyl-L-alanine amidase